MYVRLHSVHVHVTHSCGILVYMFYSFISFGVLVGFRDYGDERKREKSERVEIKRTGGSGLNLHSTFITIITKQVRMKRRIISIQFTFYTKPNLNIVVRVIASNTQNLYL